jgi:hypothetical protein
MASYSDRKNTMSKRDLAGLSKWGNRPAGPPINKVTEERKKVWTALNELITERGGRLTSIPYASPLCVEVRKPDQLAKSGFHILFVCRETRVTGASSVFAEVDVLEIKPHGR